MTYLCTLCEVDFQAIWNTYFRFSIFFVVLLVLIMANSDMLWWCNYLFCTEGCGERETRYCSRHVQNKIKVRKRSSPCIWIYEGLRQVANRTNATYELSSCTWSLQSRIKWSRNINSNGMVSRNLNSHLYFGWKFLFWIKSK